MERELASLVGPIASWRQVDGGLTNTLFRVERVGGDVVAVKLFTGDGYAPELACLEQLRHVVPVPELVHRDDPRRALVYRWIDGITLNELRRREPRAVTGLAGSLGKLLARLATVAPSGPAIPRPTDARLAGGLARQRLGSELADQLRRALEAEPPALAPCLVHGDLSGRNVLVRRAGRWRLSGVIDWERAHAGSPLEDIGRVFQYPDRYDAAFRAAFARGYRGGRGALPDSWWLDARIADAGAAIETLALPRELPDVFAELRGLLARLVADVAP